MTNNRSKDYFFSPVLCEWFQRSTLCIVFFLSSFPAFAQDPEKSDKVDSLIVRLSELNQSPEKVDVLNQITAIFQYSDADKAKEYGLLSVKLARKIEYKEGEMKARLLLGQIFLFLNVNVVEAFNNMNQAMKLAVALDDKNVQGKLLEDMGFMSASVGDYQEAIQYYHLSLMLGENRMQIYKKLDIYGRIAENYMLIGDTSRAIFYYQRVQSHPDIDEFSDSSQVISIFLADYYIIKGEYQQSLKYAKKGMEIAQRDNNNVWISYIYSYIAGLQLKQGDFHQAIESAQKGLRIASTFHYNKERSDNLTVLSQSYYEVGDFQNAANYIVLARNLNDSIYKLGEESRKSQFKTVLEEQLRKQEKENAIARLREKHLQSENDKLLIRSIALGLIITCFFLFVLYRRLIKGSKLYDQLKYQKEELQKLSIVAANIEQMVMIAGKDDRIEWVNKAFELKFGFKQSQAVGKTPYELLGGQLTDKEQVKQMNRKIFDEKIAFESRLTQYASNNVPFLTRLHITPILNEEENLDRYVVISHDITEEQKVAQELFELSLVASKTTNSIVIFNMSKEIIWVNDGFIKLTGLESEYVVGKKIGEIYNGTAISEDDQNQIDQLYSSGKPFTIEQNSINRNTNNTYWISINVTPIYNERGEQVKYISVATDISDIKQLEEQYERLVEGSTDMIYEINVEGRFVFVNDLMSDALGYSKEEIKQTHFLSLIDQRDKDRVDEHYKNQVRNHQQTSYIEFRTITKEGKLMWVGQRARIKWNLTGDRIVGFSIVTREITDQKLVEENLIKTYDNARLLSEIGLQITATHSIPEIIDQVYDNINKLMDAAIFGIAIPDKSHKKLVFPHLLEKGRPLDNLSFDLDDDSRLATLCFKENREIIMGDFNTEFPNFIAGIEYVDPIAGEQSLSIIYLPLVIRGNVIGVITVQSFEKNAYDEYQVSLVKSLASFVAIAMENAGLYENMEDQIARRTLEVRKQKEELEVNYFNTRMLSDIGQLISSSLDLDKIFHLLYEKVGLLMDAEIFAVRLYDEEANQIHFQYTIEKGLRCKPFSISMNEVDNYNVWCIQNRKEIFLNDNRSEYHKYVKEIQVLQGEMPNSLLFYPMIVNDKMVGIITIQSFKFNAYQNYHLDILKTLASYIGTAIENEKLYATLEEKVKLRTEELEQKNSDITASINYAKRLQKGILPDKSFMHQLLTDSFVYFKPKDIVSGDFYWVDRTQNKILFAVVDCTGHGVPGAMMSIIGRNLLDQAVNEKGLTLPSQILNFLQVGLSLAFGQTADRKADLFDGMDLALCSIDLQTNILEFAGANNSLYLIQDDEMIVLKGDRIGISLEYEISHFYTNVEIEIKKGDVIYLSSDGFPDQFGGPRHKKYTYNRMEELFKKIYKLDMEEQLVIVKNQVTEWRGERDQTDDICVMGVRIT